MESRLSIRGNAVEPVLLMFPLGLLTVAVLLDVFQVLGGPRFIGTLAYCTVAAGLLGGTMTAIVVRTNGLSDGNRAGGRPVTRRILLDLAVLIVFAVILLLRMRSPERTVGSGLLVVELMGLGMAGAGGLSHATVPYTGRASTGAQHVRLAQILDDPAERRGGRADEVIR
jgi:uncharacterized membrane protein